MSPAATPSAYTRFLETTAAKYVLGLTATPIRRQDRTVVPEARSRAVAAVGILPVVSDIAKVRDELPEALRHINCLDYRAGGAQRVATGLLECAGRRRRSSTAAYLP